MMKRTLIGGMIIVVFLGILIPECGATNAFDKMKLGFKNLCLAPVEIPAGMVSYSKDHNPIVTLFIGGAAGIGNCLTRAAAGVVEIVTFPLPPYDQPLYERELGETVWEME